MKWLLENLTDGLYEPLLTWLLEVEPGFPDPRAFQLPVTRRKA